ncbi:MAG TPA: hypothetical protein DCL72_07850 [Rhizobiales bacterium]|nr:hypothetical protein [Hyphomicrobiales bacterium]
MPSVPPSVEYVQTGPAFGINRTRLPSAVTAFRSSQLASQVGNLYVIQLLQSAGSNRTLDALKRNRTKGQLAYM